MTLLYRVKRRCDEVKFEFQCNDILWIMIFLNVVMIRGLSPRKDILLFVFYFTRSNRLDSLCPSN